MSGFFHQMFTWVKGLGWGKIAVGVVVLIVVIVGGRKLLSGGASSAIIEQGAPQVSVASVSDLSSQTSSLSLVGTVQSTSEADVHAESSGPVTALYYSLGAHVGAGAVIAELENSSQRAAVQQAQGGVDAAQAALNKIGVGAQSAKASAVNALLSAYASVDSSIRGTTDPMFTNPTGNNPQFNVSSSDSQLVNSINQTRPTLTALLNRETSRASSVSVNDDLAGELATTIAETRTVREFVDMILSALNSGIPSSSMPQATINGYITAATAARASLSASLSTLTSAQATLASAQQQGGGTSPDQAAGQAALTSAQGALAAARANLEKSIIRAPISGTINSLTIKRGDFVQQFSPVATIANNGALEVVAYLSQQDTATSAVGDKVEIEGGATGVITHIAPALDPVTKKIEVRIGVSGNASLVNGQSVIVILPHSNKAPTATTGNKITIPITALKIGSTETDVFTVASSTLVAHPVTIGELLGDRVVILSGLTPDMIIVVDARGLREGEVVEVGASTPQATQ